MENNRQSFEEAVEDLQRLEDLNNPGDVLSTPPIQGDREQDDLPDFEVVEDTEGPF